MIVQLRLILAIRTTVTYSKLSLTQQTGATERSTSLLVCIMQLLENHRQNWVESLVAAVNQCR
jgi:hypothetical protein